MKNEKQQDEIEERAKALIKVWNDKQTARGKMGFNIYDIMADFARAETATLTAERDRLKEALRDLNQMAADVRDVFCPQTNNEAKALINLTSALANAEAILSADDNTDAQ